ncbi:MAG TPA: histidine kinase [Candidatus Dormibacteraeota bacterium]|nr:histidine kinase [Candidatus Dormibacteraeota bacterium]
MHPLLTRGRFGAYLLAWIPLAAILVYLMATAGHLSWTESIVLVLPLSALYVLVCLAAWYPAKGAPLETTPLSRLALTHLIAAALLSLAWVQIAKGLAYALSRFPTFAQLPQHLAPHIPILFGAGFLLYLLAVAYHYVVLSLEASQEAEARVMKSGLLARDAELRALKAQVNPHFLFNSLNSISALTSIDPERARDMCILLAEFLRMTLGLGEKTSIPLQEELGMLERFMAIEKVRFGARLQMEEDIQEACKPLLIPALLLQPLIENAVGHGIANLPEGGTVWLAAHCTDGRLEITIRNTFDPESTSARRSGRGLANVRRRLEARYADQASLQARADGNEFRVDLSLPAETKETQP